MYLQAILAAAEDTGLAVEDLDGFASCSNHRYGPPASPSPSGSPSCALEHGLGGGGAAAVGNAAAAAAPRRSATPLRRWQPAHADAGVVFSAVPQGEFAPYGLLSPARCRRAVGVPGHLRWHHIGEPADRYPGHMWHHARYRTIVAARANGISALDGPCASFGDADGYRCEAWWAATLGCVGTWAIQPGKIALVNELFAPTAKEVERAREAVEAGRAAEQEGLGAATLGGMTIDAATAILQGVVARADLIEARTAP